MYVMVMVVVGCMCENAVVLLLRYVQLFVTQWTVAHQAPLSRGFPRQGYWSGLLFPSPGGLPWPKDQTRFSCCISCIAGGYFTTEPPGKPMWERQRERERESELMMRLICYSRNLVDDFLNWEKSRISSINMLFRNKAAAKRDENEQVEYREWAHRISGK